MITHMLTMFEPKTFPTETAAPPQIEAITATVSSGSEVEKAIRLKPTAVLPSWVMAETLTALFITRLLAQLSAMKEMAIIRTLTIKSVNSIAAIFPFSLPVHF